MPDISMCQDHNCPLKEKCYRYRAIPSQWQSYSIPDREGKKCKDFMSILEGDRLSVVEWEGGVPSISSYSIATGKVDEVIKELEDNGFKAIDIAGKKADDIKPLVEKYRKDMNVLEAYPPLLLNDVSGRSIQTEWSAWNVNFGPGASKGDKIYLPNL